MHNHIKRKHPSLTSQLKEEFVGPKQMKLNFRPVEQSEEFTTEGLRKRIVEIVVTTDQSFTVVDEEAFQNLLLYCVASQSRVPSTSVGKRALIPCAKILKTDIMSRYEVEKSLLANILNNVNKISFIVNAWTSLNQAPFLGTLASWMDENWTLQVYALDLAILEGAHTGTH